MRLRTTSLALLALLVSTSVSLPHWAAAAPKVHIHVPPGQQRQQGPQGGGPIAVPEASATLLLALGLGGVVALEWWRRKHAAEAL